MTRWTPRDSSPAPKGRRSAKWRVMPMAVIVVVSALVASNVFAQAATTTGTTTTETTTTGTTTTGTTTTGTTTTGTSTTGTTTTGPATTGAVGACASATTSVAYLTQVMGMFHYTAVYGITNNGTSSCSLAGYPRIAAYHPANVGVTTGDTAGAALALAVSDGQTPVTAAPAAPVDLQPGSSADVVLSYNANSGDGSCGTSIANMTTVTITPPGSSQASAQMPWAFNICPSDGNNQISVSPVMAPAAAEAAVEQAG